MEMAFEGSKAGPTGPSRLKDVALGMACSEQGGPSWGSPGVWEAAAFCRIKTRSLGGALIQQPWCPDLKRNCGHRCERRWGAVGVGRQRSGWCVYETRNDEDGQATSRSWERGPEQMLSRSPQKEPAEPSLHPGLPVPGTGKP